jgi:hypothetical protein
MANAASPVAHTTHLIEERARTRRTLWRMALLYVPSALASGGLTLFALSNVLEGRWGALVGVFIVGIVAVSTGFHAIAAVRDLTAQPVVTRGRIRRMWDKGTVLWMSRSYYCLVGSTEDDGEKPHDRVFVLSQVSSLQLEEGQSVEIEHWPHTHTVVRVALITSNRPKAARRGRPTR